MKRCFLLVMMIYGLWACDNSATAERKADSLKQKLDTGLTRLQDSVKAKGERTLDAVKEKLNHLGNKKDTVKDSAH